MYSKKIKKIKGHMSENGRRTSSRGLHFQKPSKKKCKTRLVEVGEKLEGKHHGWKGVKSQV